MRIAVVTPYLNEPDRYLREAHDSVRAQTHPADHILIADGKPKPLVESFQAAHVVLAGPNQDSGGTPRGVGSVLAATQGYDGVMFLDADNWMEPDHIASLVALHERTGAPITTSDRKLCGLDGTVMATRDGSVDGVTFVDTGCFLVTRAAFHILPFWMNLPRSLAKIHDLLFWMAICAEGIRTAHSGQPTFCYRTAFATHYYAHGREPPAGVQRDVTPILHAQLRWSTMAPRDRARALFCHLPLGTQGGGPAAERRAAIEAIASEADYAAAVGDRVVAIETHRLREEVFTHATFLLKRGAQGSAADLGFAEKIYRIILDRYPDHGGSLHNLALLLDHRGATAEAAQRIALAVAAEPDVAIFRRNAASILVKTRDYAAAATHLRRAIEIEPSETLRERLAAVVELQQATAAAGTG